MASNTGLVLWIVPNEAIYTQTKKHLSNREHPYRQRLERAAAGKVKILEKDDRLNRRDLDSHLCVMLLMLQAANRKSKETLKLKLFRDRGNVHGFFPHEDDFDAHFELLGQIPNLTTYSDRNRKGAIVQDSLGNVLRLIRPVVIMDEGHKAYSTQAIKTVYDFNPCFVLELSATPRDRQGIYSNWLVDVRGMDLDREEMIKLPINVKVRAGDDWRDCLKDSVDCLKGLHQAAEALQSDTNRYIRPILLVQVERTGKEQRETGFIHAEDAKEHLLRFGFHEREIAIKTAEVNDLKAPENLDLLSPTCPVRVIITKQALQEGWDCPFAYVLCALSASHNLNAMTQLIGRILRQPKATKTSVVVLDECYVFCHHAKTKEIVDAIKQGLEKEGMADLAPQIRESENGGETKPRKIARRRVFRHTEIFLPVVLWVEGETIRPLDYEQDILYGLDWDAINIQALVDSLSPEAIAHGTQVTRVRYSIRGELESEEAIPVIERAVFDPGYATRVITDIVPNPWIARRLVGELWQRLKERGFSEDKLGELSSYIIEELRKHLLKERDRIAENKFMAEVAAERIQFRLRTNRHNWRLPQDIVTDLVEEKPPQLIRDDGRPVEKNLFSPVYRADFNDDEAEFACYIDEVEALKWWHRNVARNGHYFVQGWRKHKVYPDFIFALHREGGKERLVVLETKGDQLEGNLDTVYKRKLLEELTKAYRGEKVIKAGELQIVCEGKEIVCDLVLMSQWKKDFHERIAKAPSSESQGQFTPGEMAAA